MRGHLPPKSANAVACMSVTQNTDRPPRYFTHISINKPVVSALKNYYIQGFLEVPTDFLNHFWIQVAVSEAKRPLRNHFGNEKVKKFNGYM